MVDNASKDGTQVLIQEKFPQIKLIENTENYGFAKATNQGLQASRGRFILLLNPDTIILDRAIIKMMSFADSHPRMGACGCLLSYPDGSFQPSAFPFPSVIGAFWKYSGLLEKIAPLSRSIASRWFESQSAETRSVDWCSGACLLVSRECVDEVGVLDEDFNLYSEEVDWCKRMHQKNWTVYYLADANVVHHLGASQEPNNLYLRRLRQLHGELQYIRKWHSPAYSACYRGVISICGIFYWFRSVWSLSRLTNKNEQALEAIDYYRTITFNQFRIKLDI